MTAGRSGEIVKLSRAVVEVAESMVLVVAVEAVEVEG